MRCLTRRESTQANFAAAGIQVEVAVGNALDEPSLEQALEGIESAYYLIHSMGDNEDFEKTDRRAAENFARAARNSALSASSTLAGLEMLSTIFPSTCQPTRDR